MTIKEALAMKTAPNNLDFLWILEKATGLSANRLRMTDENTPLTPEAAEAFLYMAEQHRNHIPLQYILGEWDFMGLTIKCRPGVLIPRRDTEVLAQEAISFSKNSTGRFTALDLCTGSGCVAIALAKHFTHVTGTDISLDALELARENAKLNGVEDHISFMQSNLFENIEGRFNCITANPPYIPTDELKNLPEQVKKEPSGALDGGRDGLDFYRAIIPAAGEFLLPKGELFLEIGDTMGKAVTEMLHSHGFRAVIVIKDLETRDRVVRGVKCEKYI